MASRSKNQPATPSMPGLVPLVGLLFAASGAAALIDQVAWTRWMTLVLGASTRATVIVLAAFMGGLGLGSWLAGRLADRHPRETLRYFAFAEVGIGLWSLLSIPLLGSWLPQIAASLAREGALPSLPLPLRVVLALGGLVIPTLLMGATMPLLARWAVAAGGLAGRDTGLLYALNTLGGAAGALLAAFVMIESLGLARSVFAAGLTDIAVALGALWLARSMRTRPAETLPPGEDGVVDAEASTKGLVVTAALAFGLSGFTGLALEVVGFRVIAVLAGSSAYAFGVMLGAFLIGIGAGSLIGTRLAERVRRPGIALGLTLTGLAGGVGFARLVFEGDAWRRVGRASRELPLLSGSEYGFELGACLVALLPATIMLGLALPFVARIAGAAPARLARRFGAAYALNTLGAVLGSLAAGLWLVPSFGSALTLTMLTLLAGAAGLGTILVAARGQRLVVPLVAGFLLTALGLGLGSGRDPVREELLGRFAPESVKTFREGPVQTIAVVAEHNFQQQSFLRLVTNRTSLTGTHLYAKRYMRLLGHLPALYSSDPSRGLVICLGTGMTAAAVATHGEVTRLDIAEISDEVVAAAPLFSDVSDDVLDDPRTRLLVEDGRHVMLASAEPWGFITLEPPPPRDSGVVSLYTRDFYELARERLVPGGVLAQWIPLHSQSLDEVRMLIASFTDAFPHALGFVPVERELLLLGSDQPLLRTPEQLAARMVEGEVATSLEEIGFDSPASLMASALLDRERLIAYAGRADRVLDDRPRVEYFLRYGKRPRLESVRPLVENPMDLDALLPPGSGAASDELRREFGRERTALGALLGAAWSFEEGQAETGERLQRQTLTLDPGNPYYLWAAQISAEHVEDLAARAERSARPEAFLALADAHARRREWQPAGAAFAAALEKAPNEPELLRRYGALLMGPLADPVKGRELLERALRLDPNHPASPEIARRLGLSRGS